MSDRAVVYVYRALWRICRALLCIYRYWALFGIDSALLCIYRALLYI